MRWLLLLFACFHLAAPFARSQPALERSDAATQPSRVIEAAGVVEFQAGGRPPWLAATNGLALRPGDRLRTRAGSRAGVQFSDRSVLRLSEDTILEIQPPRRTEKRRFRLPVGSIFFLHREQPADLEFETPVASGAIRGTEFILEADAVSATTRLALLEGQVELSAADQTVTLQGGEQARIEPGRPPVKSPLLEIASLVQWTLYYPAVVNPEDLPFDAGDRSALNPVLIAYQSGDLLAAHAAMTAVPSGGENRELWRAALDLAVGRAELAEARLALADPGTAVGRALREILTLTRGNAAAPEPPTTPSSASEWLARSYALQARFRLAEARDAAARAVLLAPRLGFAHARLAELEFSLEHRRQALTALDAALRQAPRLASAHALKGFVLLEDHRPREALVAFDRAIALDAALGHAWLGRGLALQRLRQQSEALLAFQTAAALEPRRALLRSYLGKAFSAAGEPALAEKDLHQARNLDPGDPTAWFYSALHHWQQNRPNRAVGELERSIELNDHRQIFRSRLGLDRDRAVRSANLAAVYEDAGLSEAGRRAAAHAVSEDYANFSAHLFLSDSYRAVEDPNRFDLRHESARFSELLVANLLAPSGSGNLSQLLPQQERLRFFDPAPLGFSSLTTFQSPGNWQQLGTAFGSLQGFSYALDVAYAWQREQEINDWRERKDASLQIKQRLGPQDELYLQVAFSDGDSGDVARHYDPTNAHPDLRVSERQVPNLLAGWHRAWTPASHTLLLLARLSDDFHLSDEGVNVLHLQPDVANAVRVSYPAGGYGLRFAGDFTLYSAELQHIWQHDRHTVVAGGRLQSGAVESEATLSRVLTGAISEDQIDEPMRRANGYLYYHVQVFEPLRLVGGASYDRLTFPRNSELAPLTSGEETIDLPTPKTGLLFTPWRGGSLRGAYTRSLGGLFFDNSVRIEPAHVAGFSQAFRSVLPESSVGLVAGSTFDTGNIAFDQRLPGGTHLGVAAEWLHSEGERTLGVTTGPAPVPFPGAVASTEQTLKFRERNFSAYAVQLLGDGLSLGARYRLSEAQLETRLPEVPKTATGLDQAEQSERSLLHQVALSLHYQHSGGAFGQWETVWHRQHNSGYTPARPGDDFWQHHFWVGYRFPRRTLEVRAGVLNLTDQDYRLNPLNSFVAPPRHRTAVVSLRLNF